MTTPEAILRVDPLLLGEGDTPVITLPRLAQHCGLDELWAKAEWINPTGSYKDRIAKATIRNALQHGASGWLGTSSGNGGAAMSAYGSRAGLPGFLCVPADAPVEKLRSITPYGTTVLTVSSLGLEEMDSIAALAAEFDLKLAVTAYRYNPEGMAGAEAIGCELAGEQMFTHVYVPTGGGGLLVATARGIASGSGSSPAVICAQPMGCAPLARMLEGEIDVPRVDTCTTSVSGLQLPDPPDADLAIQAVRSSGGWGRHVSDSSTWEAQSLLAKFEGVFVEPAAAVAIAAVIADARSGRINRKDRPVAVLTGSGLKDLRRFTGENARRDVVADIVDLRSILENRIQRGID